MQPISVTEHFACASNPTALERPLWCHHGNLCRNPFSTIKLSHEEDGLSRAGAVLGTLLSASCRNVPEDKYGFELARDTSRDIHCRGGKSDSVCVARWAKSILTASDFCKDRVND
jgi:hypothetical protein